MGGTLMISGNMRPLANVAATATAINFNSSNMIGCTIFCIQYALYAGGTLGINIHLNGSSSDYKSNDMYMDKTISDAAYSSSGTDTNMYVRVLNHNTSSIVGGASMSASDGMSGELWVKGNKRDSSYQMFTHRGVYWDANNKLQAAAQSGHWYGDGSAAINSIEFDGGGVSMVMRATLWGGLD